MFIMPDIKTALRALIQSALTRIAPEQAEARLNRIASGLLGNGTGHP